MDPQIVTIICAVLAALAVAIPALVTARNTNNLMDYRLTAMEGTLKELKDKLEGYSELHDELIKAQVRIETLEREVKVLKQSNRATSISPKL